MILYLDTSALVKLYAVETGRDTVLKARDAAELVVSSTITYVEARSAFAQKRRLGTMSDPEWAEAKRALEDDWERLYRVEVTEPLIRRAAGMAEELSLRAYDALHLAAAETVGVLLQEPVRFACFDQALSRAAGSQGFETTPQP